jgi:hypothetical protein
MDSRMYEGEKGLINRKNMLCSRDAHILNHAKAKYKEQINEAVRQDIFGRGPIPPISAFMTPTSSPSPSSHKRTKVTRRSNKRKLRIVESEDRKCAPDTPVNSPPESLQIMFGRKSNK